MNSTTAGHLTKIVEQAMEAMDREMSAHASVLRSYFAAMMTIHAAIASTGRDPAGHRRICGIAARIAADFDARRGILWSDRDIDDRHRLPLAPRRRRVPLCWGCPIK